MDKRSDNRIGTCWSCRGPIGHNVLFCHTCGAVQPPLAADHFARFGLERTFDVDTGKLEKLYLALQRHLHPDRFANKSPKERAIAESQSVDLNDAFETLDDPLRRAIYLLRLHGEDPTSATEKTVHDPELLMEIMEQREALADADTREEVEKLAAKAGAEAISLVSGLSVAFAQKDYIKADQLTTRLKYLRKFLSETRARLATMETA